MSVVNRNIILVSLMGILLLSIGCHRAPVPRVAKYKESEFAPYNKEGTSTITGQAFVRTIGGDVKFAAGLPVYLVPVTSYSTEWFKKYVRGGVTLTPEDQRAAKYTRQTIGDGTGHFKFEKVTEGQYYVVSRISWMYQTQLGFMGRTADFAAAKVQIGKGATVEVIASSN